MTTTLPLTPDQLYDLATRTDKPTFKRIVGILYHNHRNHIDAGQVASRILRELDTRGAVSRDALVMDNRKLVVVNQRLTTQIAQIRAQTQANRDTPVRKPQRQPARANEIDLDSMSQEQQQAYLLAHAAQIRSAK